MGKQYKIKDLGIAEYILGIRVSHNSSGSLLNQDAFAKKVVKKYSDTDYRIKAITALPELLPHLNQEVTLLDEQCSMKFKGLVGAIGYLSQVTRPDLSVAHSTLGSYLSQPTEYSWKLGQHVLT